jgi:hypothetical protein
LPSFLLPVEDGKMFFTWTPGMKPAPEMMGPDDTLSRNLYMASPGNIAGEWMVDLILSEMGISRLLLSPDQMKIALLYLEDTNQNGHYNELGGDTYKLGIYDISTNSLTPLTIDGYIYGLSWLDNQTLVFSQNTNLAFIQLDGVPPIWLTNNPPQPAEGEPYNLIRSVTSSPNGQYQAVGVMPGIALSESRVQPTGEVQLVIYDIAKAQFIPVIHQPGQQYMSTVWSPNSQWLAVVPGYQTNTGRSLKK